MGQLLHSSTQNKGFSWNLQPSALFELGWDSQWAWKSLQSTDRRSMCLNFSSWGNQASTVLHFPHQPWGSWCSNLWKWKTWSWQGPRSVRERETTSNATVIPCHKTQLDVSPACTQRCLSPKRSTALQETKRIIDPLQKGKYLWKTREFKSASVLPYFLSHMTKFKLLTGYFNKHSTFCCSASGSSGNSLAGGSSSSGFWCLPKAASTASWRVRKNISLVTQLSKKSVFSKCVITESVIHGGTEIKQRNHFKQYG